MKTLLESIHCCEPPVFICKIGVMLLMNPSSHLVGVKIK